MGPLRPVALRLKGEEFAISIILCRDLHEHSVVAVASTTTDQVLRVVSALGVMGGSASKEGSDIGQLQCCYCSILFPTGTREVSPRVMQHSRLVILLDDTNGSQGPNLAPFALCLPMRGARFGCHLEPKSK